MDLYFHVAGHTLWIPEVVGLGVGVGFIAGLFGVGGGFLLVPLLNVVLGVPLPQAVGAGLCLTIATALSAHLRHRGLGTAEGRFDLTLVGGSLLGVDAGTRLLTYLDRLGSWEVLGRSFSALQLVGTLAYGMVFLAIASVLWFKSSPEDISEVQPGPFARVPLPPYIALPTAGLRHVSGPMIGMIGFCTGVMAGLIGVGGGIILIPVMLYGFGFDIRKASGTGIIVVLSVALLGTFRHATLGHVHLGLAATLMIGAPLTAQFSAGLTRSLPAIVLRRGLAIVLLITVSALVFKLLR